MIENLIIQELVHSEEYARKVLPFLKPEYFYNRGDLLIYEKVKEYFDKYNRLPNIEAIAIECDQAIGADEMLAKATLSKVEALRSREPFESGDWLLDKTEQFCKDQAMQNSLRASIAILDGQDQKHDRGHIVALMQNALSVSFDKSIGHDYFEDSGARYEFYHKTESRIPFGIAYLNKITNGGLLRKTLNMLMGGTGAGKSLVMCSMAADHLRQGLNVLYVTMELSEEMISQRIDVNLMDCNTDELTSMPRNVFDARIDKAKSKTKGKLVVKEYPTGSAGAANFRHLLNELKLKKNFVPDVIYIDYLNICISSRMKMGNTINSYTFMKAVAEELRGLAVEFNVPIITATQMNRDGVGNSDPELSNVSESIGTAATVDLLLSIIVTEELSSLGQMLFKQLKNRYRDENRDKRFLVGVDKEHMRLYDLEESAQKGLGGNDNAPQPAAKKFESSRFDDVS